MNFYQPSIIINKFLTSFQGDQGQRHTIVIKKNFKETTKTATISASVMEVLKCFRTPFKGAEICRVFCCYIGDC